MTDKSDTYILALNCGSSSLKFGLYSRDSLQSELSGIVNRIGDKNSHFEIKDGNNAILESRNAHFKDIKAAAKALVKWLKVNKQLSIAAIGHRLVQGGPDHRQPEIITHDLLKTLHKFIYLAPNHLPDEISTIKIFQAAFPDLPQVACFDTAFHKDIPAYAKYYPLPGKYKDKGLMRYGFHGLSCQYIMQKLGEESPSIAKQKIIIAHLGNGASMTAVKDGISVDTTMGLSPIGGLVMGTRSGDLDPGVTVFLLKQSKLSANNLDELLSKRSGLKAIAGTNDVQELLKNEKADPKAALALLVFCYSARKFIGALAASMGGLDLLVFTGGIGENSAVIRERICAEMNFMGIEIDSKKNSANEPVVSRGKTHVSIRVIKTDEELMIAKLAHDIDLK
jgi:acetate kinase